MEVVCGLIQRDGCILLAQRPAGKHLALKWEFPGGKVEPGEAHWPALQRELEEELGCRVEDPLPLPCSDHEYEHLTARMIPFLCRVMPGTEEPAAREHQAIAWVPWHLIDSYDLAAADLPVLEHALKWRAAIA